MTRVVPVWHGWFKPIAIFYLLHVGCVLFCQKESGWLFQLLTLSARVVEKNMVMIILFQFSEKQQLN
jgi:hypothetical protein